jgi:hypothetical protein
LKATKNKKPKDDASGLTVIIQHTWHIEHVEVIIDQIEGDPLVNGRGGGSLLHLLGFLILAIHFRHPEKRVLKHKLLPLVRRDVIENLAPVIVLDGALGGGRAFSLAILWREYLGNI